MLSVKVSRTDEFCMPKFMTEKHCYSLYLYWYYTGENKVERKTTEKRSEEYRRKHTVSIEDDLFKMAARDSIIRDKSNVESTDI